MKIDELKVSDIFNYTKNSLMLPPILFSSYVATKQITSSIDIAYFNQIFDTLTTDLTNSATLGALITSSYLIARTESYNKILGSMGFMISNVSLISKALEHNPEPFFIAQNAILTILSAKTILYELSENNKPKISNDKPPLNDKIKAFLSNKAIAINNSVNRFYNDVKGSFKPLFSDNNKPLLSSLFIAASAYLISKNVHIDINSLSSNLDVIAQKGQQMLAMGLTFYGSYKLSQGKALETGISYLGANSLWFANANSNLHEISTILFAYTSALMAYNGAKELEETNDLKSLKTTLNDIYNKIKCFEFNSLSKSINVNSIHKDKDNNVDI